MGNSPKWPAASHDNDQTMTTSLERAIENAINISDRQSIPMELISTIASYAIQTLLVIAGGTCHHHHQPPSSSSLIDGIYCLPLYGHDVTASSTNLLPTAYTIAGEGGWSVLAPSLPITRYASCMTYIGTRLYIAGGQSFHHHDGSKSLSSRPVPHVDCLDLKTGSWHRHVKAMHQSRCEASHAMIDGGWVIVGGWYKSSSHPLATAEVYDVSRNEWHVLPTMHVPRCEPCVTVLEHDHDLYVIGGCDASFAAMNHCERFNTRTCTWTVLPHLNRARYGAVALPSSHRNSIVVMGGVDGGGLLDTIEEYIPATNEWRVLPLKLPYALRRFTAQWWCGWLIITGGTRYGAADALQDNNDTWATIIDDGGGMPEWRRLPALPCARSGLTSSLIYM